MSFTSEWEWESINRDSDASVSGGLRIERNNWSLVRSRWSDQPFSSEKGDTSQSLVGYNGGAIETITPPTIDYLFFDTTRNWVRTSDVFVEAGYSFNGRPVYVPYYDIVNIPSASLTRVIYTIKATSESDALAWVCTQIAIQDLMSQNLLPYYSDVSYPELSVADSQIGFARSGYFYNPSYLTPNGCTFTTTGDLFSGASTPYVSTTTGKFYCRSDSQVYPNKGVNWYRQVQTWVYIDSYKVA